MKVGLLKNFVHYFNLEEGTVLIAVFQLLISGFNMTFFVLALVHTMGIQEMVVRDTEDALEREALEDISSNHLNTKKMDMAHHNATETVYSIYCGLVITVIHFISTILLLYGVLAVITVYVVILENNFMVRQVVSFGRTIATSWRPGWWS